MTTKFGVEIIVNSKTIWIFPENVTAALQAGQAKINAGVVYAWSRGPGEEPLSLGTFMDLVSFINTGLNMVGFDVKNSFTKLIGDLPSPIDDAVENLVNNAVFELDSLRLKIPASGSGESMKFEIAMIINLVKVNLSLGNSLQLTRIYAQMGNFTEPQTAIAGANPAKPLPPAEEGSPTVETRTQGK